MRKFAIFSKCYFTLKGISSIVHESEPMMCLLTTNNHLTLYSAFNSDIELDDVFVHVQSGVIGELRLIQGLIRSSMSPRVIVMVDNAHAPILKLLRAMGVVFFLSLRDPLSNIGKIFQSPALSHYMRTELYSVIKTTRPVPAWAAEWGAFDDAKYFTPMETEIILDLLQGISPLQVARKRVISVKTVSAHKLNALKKMELRGLNEFFITPRRERSSLAAANRCMAKW